MGLDKKIIAKIEREGIRIKPRWFFVAKEISNYAIAGILIITVSISIGVFGYLIKENFSTLTFSNVPYFWLFIIGMSMLLVYHVCSRLEYAFKFKSFLPMVLLINVALGLGTFASGKAGVFERKLEKNSVYTKVVPISIERARSEVEKIDEKASDSVEISPSDMPVEYEKNGTIENEASESAPSINGANESKFIGNSNGVESRKKVEEGVASNNKQKVFPRAAEKIKKLFIRNERKSVQNQAPVDAEK